METYEFVSSNQVGKISIPYVTKYFTDEGFLVTNVEDVVKYQAIDVDLVIEICGETRTVEVKTDTHKDSGFYAFEIISNDTIDSPGCFLYSEADILAICFPNFSFMEIHLFPFRDIRNWFMENETMFKEVLCSTGGLYNSVCKLVPLKDIPTELRNIVKIPTGNQIPKSIL